MKILLALILTILTLITSAEQATTNKTHGLVGLRPLPRTEADWKSNHGGSWDKLPTFEAQKGNYPEVAKRLDVISNWMDGDFKTKKVFFEHYLGLSPEQDAMDLKKNSLIKKIVEWESKGGEVIHILICREYRLAIQRGYPDAVPGPFKEDTRILFEKDVDELRALFKKGFEEKVLKFPNYRLIQMVEHPTFFSESKEFKKLLDKMEGIAYEAHQFNRHWPLETGWSAPEKVVKGAKWTVEQGKEYIFYYGPILWKSKDYQEFIERDWMKKYWEAGLPKHNPLVHYYLNTFPHAEGRGRPVGPETDPNSVLGFTKWLIEEIKGKE